MNLDKLKRKTFIPINIFLTLTNELISYFKTRRKQEKKEELIISKLDKIFEREFVIAMLLMILESEISIGKKN
jgi:hypothetical protein